MRPATLAFASALAVVLAACSGSSAPAVGGSSEVSLSLTEFKFTPAPLQANAGATLKLALKNAGTVEHDFTIEKLGIKILLKPGETAERSIGPLAAGTYEVLCTVAGHKEAGMITKLTVK